MTHEIELGYLVLEVHDPEILTPVFGNVVGLMPGDPTTAGPLSPISDCLPAMLAAVSVLSSRAKRVGVSTSGVGPTGATTADLRDGDTAVSARRDHDGV
jgi:hypothetical protein